MYYPQIDIHLLYIIEETSFQVRSKKKRMKSISARKAEEIEEKERKRRRRR